MKLNWKTLFLLTTCCTLGLMTNAKAQITPDNSLGAESSTVGLPNQAINGIPINQIDQINGGARRGGNLFHSFGEFNVNAGRGAYFTNPDGVGNILTRVTGINRSNILGTLGVLGNANLFLINPNGIFFGPNASLDVRGSFLGSSANSLLFDNGFEFSATNPQAPPLLTVNIPVGLRFRDSPGNITNQSVVQDNTGFGIGLQVNPGNSLALVGGNVSLEQGGRLTAAGGRIELGGLAGAGTVGLQTTGNTFRLNFPANGLSNVSLLDDARVAVRSNGGGEIAVNANIFTATNGGRLVGGIEGIATRNGGDITVNSNEFNISGVGLQSGVGSGIYQQVIDGASGNAGNITINAGTVSFIDGAQISSSTSGRGNAGNVTLRAENGDISLAGSFIFSNVLDGAQNGQAGNITIKAGSFSLLGGAELQSGIFEGGQGNGGNVTIDVPTGIVTIAGRNSSGRSGIFNDVESRARGNAGNIFINAGSIFTDGAVLLTRNAGDGLAGTITLNARDQISINGSLINSSISGRGNAGNISLQVGDAIALTNGSVINSSTSGIGNAGNISLQVGNAIALANSSTITSNVQQGGSGIGGDIDIQARSLTLTNGSQIQAGLFRQVDDIPGGIGTGGSIKINASDFVDISGLSSSNRRSGIFTPAETGSTGPGGSIDITTGAFRLSNFGIVNAETANGNNGGDITINAKTFEVTNGLVQTALSGQAEVGRLFSAGDIQLNVTDSVTLKDGSEINSSTSGRGNAGNISLQVGNALALSDFSLITTNVQQGGSGIGGDIDIRGRSLTLTNGSQIQAGLFAETNGVPGGNGTGGSIKINASDFVDISGFNPVSRLRSGIFASAETGSTGSGGSIDITTGAFRLSNFGVVTARNDNGNNGGDITINAKTFEATNGLVQTILSGRSQTDGLFSAGDIQLNVTDFVSLKDGSLINSSTSGRGNAGNVSLQVGDAIALSNSSAIASIVGQGGEGIGGDINIRGRSFTLTGGSFIGTSLFREGNGLNGGKGRAGNIDINATDFINIIGVGTTGFSSGLFASAETGTTATSPQAAGNINLTTGNFRIADGAVIDAVTDNSGNAGNITINANTFTANGGGQLITTTLNSGSAGNINLNVRDRITISGSDPNFNQRIQGTFDNQGAASGIFANTAPNSTGNGGNITIQPLQNRFPTIAISDGGEVTVASQGQGQGGEISITGNSLTLDRGIINASTQSANGGNINLRLRNFIRLRNESLISANARGQQSGNGGNITINTPFIVAFPQNNDIIANAVGGEGGRVTINRSAILFGIAPLRRADLQRSLGDNNLDPRRLPTSDITAFSEQNLNFGDNVQVNSPDVDPSRGLVELPEAVTDPTQKVAQNPCRQGIGNEFFVTGRGGLPTTPNQPLNSDNVRVDLLQPVTSSGNSRATIKPASTITARRVPAQGWIFNDKGQVVLTAYDPTNTDSQRPFRTAAACPAR